MSALTDALGHVDDGDGRCPVCYEQWPCEISQGKSRSAFDRWAGEAIRKEYELKNAVKFLQTKQINELAQKLGYNLFAWMGGASSQMVTADMMLELLERIDHLEAP